MKIKNNHGFSLVEVIVSIVIISITVAGIAFVFISHQRIEKRLSLTTNTLSEIENIYNIFSADPSSFITNIESTYENQHSTIERNDNPCTFTIYYNGEFYPTIVSNKIHDIQLVYTISGGLYTLKMDPHNGIDYSSKPLLLERSIRVED